MERNDNEVVPRPLAYDEALFQLDTAAVAHESLESAHRADDYDRGLVAQLTAARTFALKCAEVQGLLAIAEAIRTLRGPSPELSDAISAAARQALAAERTEVDLVLTTDPDLRGRVSPQGAAYVGRIFSDAVQRGAQK